MRFIETPLSGAFIIDIEPIEDERGFFTTSMCETQFRDRDLEFVFKQSNISYNYRIQTLRGMHYSSDPHQEIKLVRCTRGSIYDVIIDLRKDSKTYCEWFGTELTEGNYKTLYIPEDFAHGYITLADSSEVFYQISEVYNKKAERGVMWNDPEFYINWPIEPLVMSDRDRNHPAFVR